MIKEALQYLLSLGEAKVQNIELRDGSIDVFSDKPLQRIAPHIPMAESIRMNTLSSLVDYIKANVDTMSHKMVIQVVSPTEVRLFSALNSERDREYLVKVEASVPSFPFDEFIIKEKFVIGLQSKFLDDPQTDKALVLKFAGTVENKTVTEYGDDGISQKASVKTGIATKSDAIVPSPALLKPFRTFTEVEQPVSQFIFRLRDGKYDGVECALYEADGGAWKNAAMKNIKEHLEKELAGLEQFVIIS